ncbi:MAG: prepilin-type N-terminal cleavage/methylation domain-containing protein [Planctomycetes bacterium]|nr:prepilin-type N-terminal cleavage/methylation domain-containing protein [Planctomycetota bacterium]
MCNPIYGVRFRRSGFTLVEILIVVAILGILAAITIPAFQGHVLEARESAAKANLQILRNVIEVYAAQHDGVPPGYPDDDPSRLPGDKPLFDQLVKNGNYMSKSPANPFNNKTLITMVGNSDAFPIEPLETDLYGWVYKPATKEIRLNWPGTDSDDIAYFDY